MTVSDHWQESMVVALPYGSPIGKYPDRATEALIG